MHSSIKYSFSLTGASALIVETLHIAEEYHKLKDWNKVKKLLSENNHLNKVKQATFNREFSEIKKRLSLLSPQQIYLIVHGSYEDGKSMIFVSLIKTYPFLFDFNIEVLLNKYLLFDRTLLESDYIQFVKSKSIQHPEIEKLTENTLKKVKQVVFKILEQVGLITNIKNGFILKPFLSNQAIKAILIDDPIYLSAFLYSNDEIKVLIEQFKDDN